MGNNGLLVMVPTTGKGSSDAVAKCKRYCGADVSKERRVLEMRRRPVFSARRAERVRHGFSKRQDMNE